MNLIRCDVCMREGPVDGSGYSRTPMAEWTHVSIVRAVDRKAVMGKAIGEMVERAQEGPAEIIKLGGDLMTGELFDTMLIRGEACVDLCPECSSSLAVSVSGTPIGDVERIMRPGGKEGA